MPLLEESACEYLFNLGARGEGAGKKFAKPGELFESVITDIYSNVLKPGDTVVDGGANAGQHSFPMAHLVGGRGKVLAVEAIPNLAERLQADARRSGLKQIQVVQRALYDREQFVEFHYVQTNPAYSGIEARRYDFEETVARIPVKTITIDHLLRSSIWQTLWGESRWRFCKLDLEGGELRALQGAKRAIGKFRPMIVFENDYDSTRFYGYSSDEWFDFFDGIGYVIFNLWGYAFTREQWGKSDIPWYFIGAPRHSEDVKFVGDGLAPLLRSYL
jgi:FkbM family methyltransferase